MVLLTKNKEEYSMSFSKSEALVLFETLANLEDVQNLAIDEASQKILWLIQAQLEKSLVDPFSSDYERILNDARKEVLSASNVQ